MFEEEFIWVGETDGSLDIVIWMRAFFFKSFNGSSGHGVAVVDVAVSLVHHLNVFQAKVAIAEQTS